MLSATGHPNPETRAEFYDGVPPKRFLAWVIDIAITALLSVPFMLPFAALGLILVFPFLMIPVIWSIVDLVNRRVSVSLGDAFQRIGHMGHARDGN